nr:hypothetical protein [Tanacetum cinerariifolium]
MASSTIPAIYIQQFWETMRYESTTGIYRCQLDEQWFNLHKDILRDALQITPINDNDPFVAPPSSNAVIEYVNTLGYPCTLRNVFAMSVNDLYQPWRARLSMINMCHTGKKKTTPLFIPSIRFTKLIIHHLKTKHTIHPITGSPLQYSHEDNVLGNIKFVRKDGREVFSMPIPDALLTDAIIRAPYYGGYLAHVAEYQRYLDGEHGMENEEAVPKFPKATKGKGKEKIIDEQVAHTLLDLNNSKKKSAADHESESDEIVTPVNKEKDASNWELTGINVGVLDEGQDRSNSGKQDKGQAGSNPEFTTTAYPNVQVNLKLPTEDHVILEEPTSSTGTLSSLQNLKKELSFTDQFFMEKTQEEEPEKTNVESEVQSMVTIPIHQDTSSVPPMTTLVLDTMSQSDSPTVNAPLLTSTTTTITITTITILPPPPPQPQQSTIDPILLQRIGELEQHMANLIQEKPALEERLNKHGSRLYNLENLNIPKKVSKVVDEIVIDAVDWAMQASLRARFNLDEAHKKKRKKHDLPRTPYGSPPPQPPPPPPLAGASSAQDYLMNDDSILDKQVHFSNDEDTRNDHLPKADMRKDWWKPLLDEERPLTPEPAWTIPSSNVSDVENNWATALVLTYMPPAENLLLAKTGDMMTFMNWYCQKVNKTVLTLADFKGQAYEVIKAFYPNVIHLQFQMEECYKMLTNQITWVNPEGDQVRIDVSRPLPLGGPPGHVTIQTQFFFNKDLDHLRYSHKVSRPALSISKMKAACYPDFRLKLLMPEQM